MDRLNSVLNKKTAINKHQDLIAFICFTAAVIFFCWRAPYSFGEDDQSAYLTIPQRLFMGDSLLTDEWHLSQLSSLFLYLPYKLYVSIIGSAQGIILFFRYLFIIFQSIISTVTYLRLREHGVFSVLACLILFFHIPLFAMALSYNSLGIGFVLLTGLLMATTNKCKKITFIIVGILLSCAVLCNPLLVFVYFLYTGCVIIYEISRKKGHRIFEFSESSFSGKTWLWISLGIFTMVTIFFAFLFSRTSLKEMLDNIPMLFTDPEHQFDSAGSSPRNIFHITRSLYEIVTISPHSFVVFMVLMFAILIDRNRIAHRLFFLVVASGVFFTYIIFIMRNSIPNVYAYWMFPLALFGLPCFILSENKDKKIFAFLWVFGILYTICLDISSAIGTVTASMGFVVSDIASVVFVSNIVKELRNRNNENLYKKKKYETLKGGISLLLVIVLSMQIIQQIYLMTDFQTISPEYFTAKSKERNEKLNVVIRIGPGKGLKTTATMAKRYNDILSGLSTIKENTEGAVLIADSLYWGYLYLNMPFATHSTGFSIDDVTGNMRRLSKYYELHPEKTPRYIYIKNSV